MQWTTRSLPAALLAVALVAATTCGSATDVDWQAYAADIEQGSDRGDFTPWPDEVGSLTFAVTPYDDREALEETYGPLLHHVSRRIGIPIDVVIAADYESVPQGLVSGRFDAALGTPLTYVVSRERDPRIRLLASQVAEGTTSYIGYVYTRADRPAESLADLRGHSFCYVDHYSTSGYVYPRAMLRKRGFDPDHFFSWTEFGGNHGTCLRRVLAGEVDAAAISSGAVATARREGLPMHEIKVLAKTPRIPYDAWIAASRLPEQAVQRLREELLAISTRSSDGRSILRGPIRLNAWIEVDDSHYDSVRAARELAKPGPAHVFEQARDDHDSATR